MEAEELVSEIRRLHPEWLLTRSDTARIARLESFWTRRVWRQARENSGALHAVGQRPEHLSPAAEAFEAQREHRRNLIHTGDDWSNLNLWAEVADTGDVPTWYRAVMPVGRRVEEWRVVGHELSWHVLAVVSRRGSRRGVGTTHADWVGAYVDIRRLTADPEGYLRLWIEE